MIRFYYSYQPNNDILLFMLFTIEKESLQDPNINKLELVS